MEARFTLNITAEQYLKYYAGLARFVQVTCRDGKTVRFPANILQTHLAHDGIHGEFVLEYDNNNRLLGLKRLG